MDLSKIPKFIIWTAIAVFIVVILYLVYFYYITSLFAPYQKYFNANCVYSNGQSVIIITAKQSLYNVTVSSFDNNYTCYIGNITSGSMGGCELNNTVVANAVYVRIYYDINNQSYQEIINCQIKSSSLLNKLFGI